MRRPGGPASWPCDEQFDLVLTDVMMPRLDGFGLIAALRADARTRHVPIVLLSARAGSRRPSSRASSVGADDYLVKPFSGQDLTARVRANLELGQLRRQIISRLRGLADAAAAVNTARTTAEVLEVAARHALAMTSAGRVVVTAPGTRAEADGGGAGRAPTPSFVLPLPAPPASRSASCGSGSGRGRPAPRGRCSPSSPGWSGCGWRTPGSTRPSTASPARCSTACCRSRCPGCPARSWPAATCRAAPRPRSAATGTTSIAPRDDELVLVIGDVVGKGVQAAAGDGPAAQRAAGVRAGGFRLAASR